MIHQVREYVDDLIRVLKRLDAECLERISWILHSAFQTGNTVFCFGNGGSAATANHLATDLAKLTIHPERAKRLRAMALTESLSTITAIGNDLAFEDIFVEQLKTLMQRDDVLIGVSTSGHSRNVLKALDYGNRMGAMTIGITGSEGRPLEQLARETLVIRSDNVQKTEDISMVAGHLLCLLTREKCWRLPADDEPEIEPVMFPQVVQQLLGTD